MGQATVPLLGLTHKVMKTRKKVSVSPRTTPLTSDYKLWLVKQPVQGSLTRLQTFLTSYALARCFRCDYVSHPWHHIGDVVRARSEAPPKGICHQVSNRLPPRPVFESYVQATECAAVGCKLGPQLSCPGYSVCTSCCVSHTCRLTWWNNGRFSLHNRRCRRLRSASPTTVWSNQLNFQHCTHLTNGVSVHLMATERLEIGLSRWPRG